MAAARSESVGRTVADALAFAQKAQRFYIALPSGFGDWFYFQVTRQQVLRELTGSTMKVPLHFHSRLVRAPHLKTTLYLGSTYEQPEQDLVAETVEVRVEGFSLPLEVQR